MKPIFEHDFYGVKPELLSYDFIAGLIVGEGTFYWTKYGKHKIPVFALRFHIRDFDLLVNVKYSLGITENIYEYTHNRRHSAFLIIRNFHGLIKIIESIYPKLTGHKKIQFINWFSMFKDNELEPRYQTIYHIFREKFPELYL